MYPRPFYVFAVGALSVIFGLAVMGVVLWGDSGTTETGRSTFVGQMLISIVYVVAGAYVLKGNKWARLIFTLICGIYSGRFIIWAFMDPSLNFGVDWNTAAIFMNMLVPWVAVTLLFLPAANRYFRNPEESMGPPGAFFAMNSRSASSEMLLESSRPFRPDKPIYLALVGAVFLGIGTDWLLRLIPTDTASDAYQQFDPFDIGFLLSATSCLCYLVSSAFLLHGANWARWLLTINALTEETVRYFFSDLVPKKLSGVFTLLGLKYVGSTAGIVLLVALLFILPNVRRYYEERDL